MHTKTIRIALREAIKRGAGLMGEGQSGKTVVKVLTAIKNSLGKFSASYWVTMEEFADAAVRAGLHRQVGITVYHIVDLLM